MQASPAKFPAGVAPDYCFMNRRTQLFRFYFVERRTGPRYCLGVCARDPLGAYA